VLYVIACGGRSAGDLPEFVTGLHPPPDAMVVAPATFNTICKWAHGSSDTLALGLLNESIGLGLPVVAVPNPSTALARRPAFVQRASLACGQVEQAV
jgi:flavoprotein